MTERRPPKQLTPERAAELKRWQTILGRANLIIEMSEADGGRDSKGRPKPLKRRALSRVALHLLNDNPKLLQHPAMLPLLRLMLRKLVLVDPPGVPSAKANGLAVRFAVGNDVGNDDLVEEARARIAEVAGTTYGAVKQAHLEAMRNRRRS